MPDDVRWIQRFDSFQNALATLERVASIREERLFSEPEILGLIQAFGFTHELSWKLVKDYYEAKGFQSVSGSRDVTRLAFRENLIENGEVWMNMIVSRNLSSHTYDSKTAEEIARLILESYLDEFRMLRTKFLEETK